MSDSAETVGVYNLPGNLSNLPDTDDTSAAYTPEPDPALVREDAAARILASITDAFFALDARWRFTFLNDQAERLLRHAAADLLGRDFWEEFPSALGTAFEQQYRFALDAQSAVTFEEYYPPPLDAWFEVRAYPSPAGLSVYFHDITERVRRGQRERFLADLAERARRLTDPNDVIGDAVRSVGEFLGVSRCLFADIDIEDDTCSVSLDYCADDSVASIAGVFPISAFGTFVVAEYRAGRTAIVADVFADPSKAPPESLDAYEAIGVRAYVAAPVMHSSRLVSALAVHSAVPRCWTSDEVSLLQAVVERTWLTVEVTRQEQALVREAEATTHILESITDSFFTLDRDWNVTRINAQAERLMTKPRHQILGRNFWEVFPGLVGTTFEHEYRRAVCEEVAVSFEIFYRPLDAWLEVRAFPSAAGLSVFYQDVTARKKTVEEREGLLAEQRARAEREALLNRIGLALRETTDPEMIQENAAALLGEALGVDRCYFSIYDAARDAVRVARDWHRPGLPSVAGEYRLSEYQDYVDALYAHGTAVIADSDALDLPPAVQQVFRSFGVRAYLSVPLFDKGIFAGAVAASMTSGPRSWVEAEVLLMEAVLTQTRTAVEAARLAQRERNIARQLQAALTPDIPGHISGMALAKYYQAALDEAGVGGDFYDVFPMHAECTALIVGDLSGKGLAAATQVATVRNMLRYALYRARTLAGALNGLNALLTEQGLVSGFATLFVAAYDSNMRALTYVNCGQEPALIGRAGGALEQLPPTGPVLGLFEGGVFEERTVALASGDVLAVFTDGLTEVGRSRSAMLGIQGLADLLSRTVISQETGGAERTVEHLVRELMTGVDAVAEGGVMRDDVCLLVGVVE